jgi:hypothetical protein
MADNRGGTGRGIFAERSLGTLRDIHIGIGAVALAGAVAFPEVAVFSVVFGYEALIAVAHEGLRRYVQDRSNSNSKPQPM